MITSLILCSSPSSDHGPSVRGDGESRGAVGGPAERSLGGPAGTQGLPVPGQVPNPLPTGGQPRLEGKTQGQNMAARVHGPKISSTPILGPHGLRSMMKSRSH